MTTKRVGLVHGADGEEGPFEATLSRQAVATLEEAVQSAVNKICKAAFDAGTIEGYEQHETDARAIDESGGSVGPLPGGTVIEVKQRQWYELAMDVGWDFYRDAHRDEAELLAAYNARESS